VASVIHQNRFPSLIVLGAGEGKEAVKPDAVPAEAVEEPAPTTETKPEVKVPEGESAKPEASIPVVPAAGDARADH
jgi:hypothetical protein